MASKNHIVILPYFCQEEVERYIKIADKIASFPQPEADVHYLLAASPRTEPSTQLAAAYDKLGKVISFQCPTQIFGYPEGPGAMFWDCMEYISANYPGNDGFSLWLESDMAPIKPDWIDRLSQQWYGFEQLPIMMGCYVPEVYKKRLFKSKKLLLEPHINGGACYAMDFARQMPAEARTGVFDMAVFQYAQAKSRAMSTKQISFSTHRRVRRDLMDPDKVLLHGFMQEKDQFIDECLAPLTELEVKSAAWNPLKEKIETANRMVRVWFVRKGRKAMLENMFLAKKQFDQTDSGSGLPVPAKRAA